MPQLNPRYEVIFKMNHIFHQPSSILLFVPFVRFVFKICSCQLTTNYMANYMVINVKVNIFPSDLNYGEFNPCQFVSFVFDNKYLNI